LDMSKTSKTIRKMCALAGILVLATTASALPVDARIMIDRALNSPTLTVRYEGANAALVELRINGESLGTRTVAKNKASGETNFTINLTELKDGDNEVEVRLYDGTGKLVGSDKSNISTDQSNYGPVFLKSPKVGAQVRGNVEINMGFGRELKNVYVSFFVDSNFKKMTNYPPYSMVWDTTGETNGWHEIEAWAIDETSTTFKTRKTRVFVDNVGGRTERPGTDLTPSNPSIHPMVDETSNTKLRTMTVKGSTVATGTRGTEIAPRVASGTTVGNPIHAATEGTMSGAKPSPVGAPAFTGPRSMTPTGSRVGVAIAPKSHLELGSTMIVKRHVGTAGGFVPSKPEVVAAMPRHTEPQIGYGVRVAASAVNMLRITKGQRIPNLTSFEVILNSAIVEFPDVQPRVDDGIPMTPFRYLMEKAGGSVEWENLTKTVSANADGRAIVLQIGDKNAKVDKFGVSLEVAPYIDRGRTIVPLSFIHDALKVNVDYDKETGHVLISNENK